MLAADAYARSLGVTHVADDPLTFALTVGERHLNFLGVTHGAVVYGIADVAHSVASNRAGLRSVMIDSHLTVSAGTGVGDTLTAVVDPISEGRRIATYRIVVTRGDGRIVGNFTGTVLREGNDTTKA